MAIVSNLTVDQGTTFSANIDVSDESGNAQNLTGYSVAGQIRKSYDSSGYTAFTAAITNAAQGTINISLAPTVTNGLTAGRYVYDVELILADSTIEKVHHGIITVNPEATKI